MPETGQTGYCHSQCLNRFILVLSGRTVLHTGSPLRHKDVKLPSWTATAHVKKMFACLVRGKQQPRSQALSSC